MPAGTITLTNNSATIIGVGTSFTTELVAGDFIIAVVGGIPYNLPIKIVNSNTQLTAITNYIGPSASGLSFLISPRDAQNLITAGIVVQNTEALRGLNYDKQNWQQVFSGAGTITVRLPDGSSFTGPSWKYLSDNMATKTGGSVPIEQGGTGATTKEGARANFDLGSSATRNAYSSSGDMLSIGDFGLGPYLPTSPYSTAITNMHYTAPNAGASQPTADAGWCHLVLAASAFYRAQLSIKCTEGSAKAFILNRQGTGSGGWTEVYTTANTTKASDGTLKAASPIARIVKNQEETQRDDVAKDGFAWCGNGTANSEAEGIRISRLDVGVYVLTGSAGLASEGWQLLPPMDPAGMGELGVVEAEQTESGGVTIRLYKRKYMLGDDGEIIKTKGELIDVPAQSWIDVRLDMPADSIWNKRQESAQDQ